MSDRVGAQLYAVPNLLSKIVPRQLVRCVQASHLNTDWRDPLC